MDANFNIPPMLNPALDKLPGAPAVRRRFSASPSNGSSFNPDATIQIYLPTGAASTVIDPSRSYLRFNLNNTYSTAVTMLPFVSGDTIKWYTHSLPPGLTQGQGCLFWLDPSIGAQNLLREFRVYQSGVPQEQMTNYDNINTLLGETEFGDSIKSGLALQMWGAGGDYYPNFGNNGLGNNINYCNEIDPQISELKEVGGAISKTLVLMPTQLPFFTCQQGTVGGNNDQLGIQSDQGQYYTNSHHGGRSGAPFWERNICVPSTSDVVKWKSPTATDVVPTAAVSAGLLLPDTSATTNYVTICMPLTSGIIGVQATKYLPSMLLASQSFYIEIKLGDLKGSIGNALNIGNTVVFGANHDGYSMNMPRGLAMGGQSELNLAWTIDNVQYVGEEIILTPELTNSLFSMAARHPIRWTTSSYRDYQLQNIFTKEENTIDQIIPSTLQSVSGIMHTFRNAATMANFYYRRNYRLNPSITSWQYRIGAEFFPQKALQQQDIVDMYIHPYAQLHATESAIEFNKMKHRMTGQGSNFVDGFSDNTAWNANLNSTQWAVISPRNQAQTPKPAVFPLVLGSSPEGTGSVWDGTNNTGTAVTDNAFFQWWGDWSRQSLLGSFVIGWDMDVYGGVRGDTRDGRSFQSDQINVMFTSGIGSKGLDVTNKIVPAGIQVGDDNWQIGTQTYDPVTCYHNVICKYDMVVTINPEGTMEVAF